ncbi:MAG: hypothetical protein KGL63_05840 [Betaproteobacteria bacterium]|nr:hypothetical protein [Betaproteobacteria bacterium]
MLNRRSLLRASALTFPAIALAACTISTVNGVTTLTISVAQVVAWGTAFDNVAKTVAGLPGIPAAVSASATALAITIASNLAAFHKAAGSNVNLTFDRTSVPAVINSLLADGKTLLADLQGVLTGVAQADAAMVQEYINAISTLVSVFEAALGSVAAKVAIKAGTVPMTEGAALLVCGVTY